LGDSLLLTEALPNAMALDQFFQQWLAQADQPRLLRILLEELAHFLAKCHQAGVLHQDLHTGNLFVEVEENFCQPETFRPGLVHFFLIDVQAVRLQGALDRQRSLQNLSLLAGAWRERTTPAQRWRFWKRYCECRPEVSFDLRRDAERLDRLGWEHRLRICRRRDRRCLATNRDFIALKTAGGKIYALADQNPDQLRLWALAPEVLVDQFLHRAMKLGHRSLVVEADWPLDSESFVVASEGPTPQNHNRRRVTVPPPHFSIGSYSTASEEFLTSSEHERVLRTPNLDASEMGAAGETASIFALSPGLLRSPAAGKEEKEEVVSSVGHVGDRTASSAAEKADLVPTPEVGPPGEHNEPASFPVVLKRFRERVGWAGCWKLFRTSRAKKAWRAGHALLQRGIATPRPIAFCEPRFRGSPYYTYLVTEWISEAQNLHLWGWQLAQLPPKERHRLAARCAESLGRLVGRLHAFQISHGDLKMSNILVAPRSGQLGVWLLDVEGVRIGRRNSRRYLKDLGRLAVGLQAHPWVSPTILCRFLRAYVRQFPPQTSPDWKTLWRKIRMEFDRQVNTKKGPGRILL